MGITNFSQVQVSNGFIGDLTGDVTGDLTGNVTGDLTGKQVLESTTFAADGAVTPTSGAALLTKGTAGAYTLAAPGSSGIFLLLVAGSAAAHVVTAASIDGGDTLTFGGAIGDTCLLYARSATAWSIVSTNNCTLSTAG